MSFNCMLLNAVARRYSGTACGTFQLGCGFVQIGTTGTTGTTSTRGDGVDGRLETFSRSESPGARGHCFRLLQATRNDFHKLTAVACRQIQPWKKIWCKDLIVHSCYPTLRTPTYAAPATRAMRQTQIFSGSSHPALVEAICDRLGQKPAKAHLSKFSNGETNIQIRRYRGRQYCRPPSLSTAQRRPPAIRMSSLSKVAAASTSTSSLSVSRLTLQDQ